MRFIVINGGAAMNELQRFWALLNNLKTDHTENEGLELRLYPYGEDKMSDPHVLKYTSSEPRFRGYETVDFSLD